MNVAQAATLVSTAAPTPMEATCVAVLEVSTELDKGEGTNETDISQVKRGDTAIFFLNPLLVFIQSLYNRLGFLRPVYGG